LRGERRLDLVAARHRVRLAVCGVEGGGAELHALAALGFATRNLRLHCLCPGGVKTPPGPHLLPRDDFEAHLIDYQAPPKFGHFADPIDIARIIAFLASDEARMISGAALTADGGTLA